MIGRAAMQTPWIFRETTEFLHSGKEVIPVGLNERWQLILRHCRLAVSSGRYGQKERYAITAMRSRLMAYCKGFPGAKELRQRLCQVESVAAVEDLAEMSMQQAMRADCL